MLYWVLTSCVNSAEDTGAQVEQPTQIVNWGDWKFADLETDPLRTHQPESIDCSPNAMQMEGEQLEIRTDFCNYAFLDFQANQDVSVDTTLAFLLLHTGLWAPEAATAHFALFHENAMLWESEFPIPSSSDFFYSELPLATEIEKGDTIRIHLHNHGPNDWKLGYLKTL